MFWSNKTLLFTIFLILFRQFCKFSWFVAILGTFCCYYSRIVRKWISLFIFLVWFFFVFFFLFFDFVKCCCFCCCCYLLCLFCPLIVACSRHDITEKQSVNLALSMIRSLTNWYLYKGTHVKGFIFYLWCLTPILAIFLLYHGDQF